MKSKGSSLAHSFGDSQSMTGGPTAGCRLSPADDSVGLAWKRVLWWARKLRELGLALALAELLGHILRDPKPPSRTTSQPWVSVHPPGTMPGTLGFNVSCLNHSKCPLCTPRIFPTVEVFSSAQDGDVLSSLKRLPCQFSVDLLFRAHPCSQSCLASPQQGFQHP